MQKPSVVRVPIVEVASGNVAFSLVFYNVPLTYLCLVPTGGQFVRAALRRYGFDPNQYMTSPFFMDTQP